MLAKALCDATLATDAIIGGEDAGGAKCTCETRGRFDDSVSAVSENDRDRVEITKVGLGETAMEVVNGILATRSPGGY